MISIVFSCISCRNVVYIWLWFCLFPWQWRFNFSMYSNAIVVYVQIIDLFDELFSRFSREFLYFDFCWTWVLKMLFLCLYGLCEVNAHFLFGSFLIIFNDEMELKMKHDVWNANTCSVGFKNLKAFLSSVIIKKLKSLINSLNPFLNYF
jgi:hypothetical protein